MRIMCKRESDALSFGFEYEWKTVSKGVLRVRNETLNDEH